MRSYNLNFGLIKGVRRYSCSHFSIDLLANYRFEAILRHAWQYPFCENEEPSHLCQLKISYDNAIATITVDHGVITPEILAVIGSKGYSI